MSNIISKVKHYVLDKMLDLILMYLPCIISLDGKEVDTTFIAKRIIRNREGMDIGDILENEYLLNCEGFGSYKMCLSYSDHLIMLSLEDIIEVDKYTLKDMIYNEMYRAMLVTKISDRVRFLMEVEHNAKKKI